MKQRQQVVLSFATAFFLCAPVIYSVEVCSFFFMDPTMSEEHFDKNNVKMFSTAEFLVNITMKGKEEKHAIYGAVFIPLDSLNNCIDEPVEFGGNRDGNCDYPKGPYGDPNNTVAWAWTTTQLTLDVIFIDVFDLLRNKKKEL